MSSNDSDAKLERELLDDVHKHGPHGTDDEERVGGERGKALGAALSVLAAFYMERRRWSDALPVLRRAVKIGSTYRSSEILPLLVDLGTAEAHCGFLDEARVMLRRAKKHEERAARKQSDVPEIVESLRALEAMLDLATANEASTKAAPAERYRHAKFGEGTLVERVDDKLRIAFADGVTRTLSSSYVTRVEDAAATATATGSA